MLFDKGLLAVGNLLFLSGVTLVIGARNTFSFFFQQHKIKGSSCFFGGIFLVLIGWPVIGILVEAFGFINLFGDFFPVIVRRLPILAQLLNFTGLREYIDKKEKKTSSVTPRKTLYILYTNIISKNKNYKWI